MKFTVEIEGFWLEEEELTAELSAAIKRDVVQQISKSIEDKIDKQITTSVTECIEHKLTAIIDSTLTDLIATGIIKKNGADITIVEHIKQMFQQNTGWNRANDQIQKIAKAFGQELKLQYNNMFANQIVQNMKEQGLLKDEVVQILLEPKKD